jgi:formate dehydrogenase subunit gamma
MGAEALVTHAQQHLGCTVDGTSKDGAFTLEAAYCLGLCASSPAMMIDDELHARVTPQAFDTLVAQTRNEK